MVIIATVADPPGRACSTITGAETSRDSTVPDPTNLD
jgi:hypothetical protein